MASNKNYTIRLDDQDLAFTFSKKERAVAKALELLRQKWGYVAEVLTPAGNVSERFARRRITKHTKPFTKVIDLPEDLANVVPEGYAAAYARYRNGAVVLRREEDLEEDTSRYAVLSTLSKEIVGYSETTRGAGALMKEMGIARKAAAV